MLMSVQVKDHMSTDLVTISEDMDILRAAHKLIRNNISGAPVVDEEGRLVGLLTERDFMRVAMQAEYHAMPGGPVRDFMTANPETVTPDESILEVAQRFVHGQFHRYPVVADGSLVGIVSRRDVMRALGMHYPI